MTPESSGAARLDRANYPDCPGPPDASRISTTGLALQSLTPPTSRFYAVTPLDGRSLAIVSMDDGGEDRMERHIAGDRLGSVWIWRPGEGLEALPAVRLRGGNGIASSADNRWLYVSAWPGAQLVRVAVDGRVAPQSIELPFLPDNVKRLPDGMLLLAAQQPPVERIARCGGPSCPADWLIVRFDPGTLAWTVVHEAPGSVALNFATGAVEHDGRIWIANRGDGRIAVVIPHP